MTKFFKKCENTIFGPLLALYAQNWTNENFLGITSSVILTFMQKNQKKLMSQFSEKSVNGKTDSRTDSDFIGPSCSAWFQILHWNKRPTSPKKPEDDFLDLRRTLLSYTNNTNFRNTVICQETDGNHLA